MRNHIESYKSQGYQPILVNASCIGAEVLVHPGLNRVVKFGQDRAYDVFVRYAQTFPSPAFPDFYHHETPAGPFTASSNEPYTVTEMECLVAVTTAEGEALLGWVQDVIAALRDGSDPHAISDPFQLTQALLELWKVAIGAGVGFDMLKSSNYMARNVGGRREIVITDPFN